MKFEIKKEAFVPLSLIIDIESHADLVLLHQIMSYDLSIPEMLRERWGFPSHQEIKIREAMQLLHRKLGEHLTS